MKITTGGHIYLMEGFGSKDEKQPGLCVYGCTKRATTYLGKALNRELANAPNVKLSTISPGMVITDLLVGEIEEAYDEKRVEKAKFIFNVLADKVTKSEGILCTILMLNLFLFFSFHFQLNN